MPDRPPANESSPAPERVRVDGKFFRLGSRKFHVKGITYGPFAPNADGEMFPSPDRAALDFRQIHELGANVVRVYYVPPKWFLDLAAGHGLKVFIDVPWPRHLCFLDSKRLRQEAHAAVRAAVKSGRDHPAVFAYSVVNEIAPDIVRWSGVRPVEKFIDELIDEAKTIDPGCLCTFASFPPTEFLRAANADFVCFNLYLHHRRTFEEYLARLQTLAEAKPLVLGEFGMDSFREGEAQKSAFLSWQIELAFRGGLAGTVVFSFTDDWFRGGLQIEDWSFGITTRERQPKESLLAVQRQYRLAPHFPLPQKERVSVVVATFNGARTLENCLQSLTRLNYPDYEIILVDDGSTDRTPEIAKLFPTVRYLRQDNQGLSAARNAGIRAATGNVIAFTDDDCRADEDWLYYLVGDLQRGDFAGVGGHNFPPPEDPCVAAAVAAAPGGPAHVMLTDREAEHIPGCNMAFYRSALEQIGMFDPQFTKAGDDVDVCWRIRDFNLKIGFSPSGFVWHYRRSTVRAYLKQQAGYGEAEALLIAKHPEHFNSLGGGRWRGRIYAAANAGLLLRGPVIYHGIFASGFFQRLYAPEPVQPLMLCTSLGYHVFVNTPLVLLACYFGAFRLLAAASLAISLGPCALAAIQANLPNDRERFWSRPLIGLLFFLQPIVRGWTRFKWRYALLSTRSRAAVEIPEAIRASENPELAVYWIRGEVDRFRFLSGIVSKLGEAGWRFKTDTGWTSYDLETPAHLWTRLRLTTVTEELEQQKRNIRCRIRGYWSLPAKIVGALTVIAVVSLIRIFAEQNPWVWMSLIALPLTCWIFDDERAEQEKALAALVDGAAKEQSLIRVEPPA